MPNGYIGQKFIQEWFYSTCVSKILVLNFLHIYIMVVILAFYDFNPM